MKEQLKSGNFLEVQISSISIGYRLFQAVVQEFKKSGTAFNIDLQNDDITDFIGLFSKNPSVFLNGLADIITSEKVMSIIFECGNRAFYEVNGIKQKVTMEAFEDPNHRLDFFEVLYKIAIVNLAPFFQKPLLK